LGKILEEVIISRLNSELKEDSIPDFQFGFREEHSTTNAISVLIDKVNTNLNLRKSSALVSLDIKKAFDSVWHGGLTFKLHKSGCSPFTTAVIHSFLSDRVGNIKLGELKSTNFPIKRGVPQGSRLGPLLYNVYISDYREALGSFVNNVVQYADDTMIVEGSLNPRMALRRAEKICEVTRTYLANWGIEMNEEKTDVMLVNPKGKSLKKKSAKCGGDTLIINGKSIMPKRELKYLGVILDDKINFKKHTEQMCKRGRQATGAARKLLGNPMLSLANKRLIYNSLIRSTATYASPIWAGDAAIKRLEIMERWAMRIALNMYFDESKKKFIKNEILYECFQGERMSEFLDRINTKYYDKLRLHKNSLIRNLVATSTE
jgi:hypothetical protein